MTARWTIAAEAAQGEISVEMVPCDKIALTQGEARIVVGPAQLGELESKLHFLHLVCEADVFDAVEYLV